MLSYKCDACKLEIPSNDVCNVNLRKEDFNANKHLCPNCFDTIVKFMSAWDSNIKAPTATLAERKAMLEDAVEGAEVVEDDSIAIWVSHTEDAKVEEPKKKQKKQSTLSEEDREAILKMYKSGVTSATKISKSLNLPYHAVYYYINKLKLYNVRVQEKPTGEPRVPKSKPPMVLPPRQTAKPQRNVSDEERQKIYANIATQMNVLASNVGTVHSLSKAGWSPKSIAYDCLGGKIELVKDILFELHKAGI